MALHELPEQPQSDTSSLPPGGATEGTDAAFQARRKVLQMLAVTGGAMAATQLLPSKWVKPVADWVVVPAHAAPSGPGTEPA